MVESTASQQLSSNTPLIVESFIVPHPIEKEQQKTFFSSSTFFTLLAGVVGLVLFGGVSLYGIVIMPRQNTIHLVDEINPYLITLKSTTSDIIDNMSSIYALATEQNAAPPKANLQTNGMIIHPDISSIANTSRVLGAAISIEHKSLIENEMQNVALSMRGVMRTMSQGVSDIAGVSTSSEQTDASTLRQLKTETVETSESIRKAQAALGQLTSIASAPKAYLPSNTKAEITSSESLKIAAKGYFSEAEKIAGYYETLSDIVIAMNTKITSFKSAIASAGSGFGAVLKSGDSEKAKTTLSQVQVFLDQADKDMKDMKSLSERLNALPSDTLPMAVGEYHVHNKKILEAATTYFTVQSGILQDLVTGAKSIVNKSDQNTLTSVDLVQFQNQMTIGISQSSLSDAKFVSDLQTLQGEEQSLAVSFWQNNTRIGDGIKVAEKINAYQASLHKIRQNNVIQGVIQ